MPVSCDIKLKSTTLKIFAIMKAVAVLFVLSCLSLSFVNSMNETTWGLVNTRVLGQETVVVPRVFGYYQVGAFAFPSVSIAIMVLNIVISFFLYFKNLNLSNMFHTKIGQLKKSANHRH